MVKRIILWVLGFVLCAMSSVYAQTMTSLQVQEHFKKGNALYKEGKFQEACAEYEVITAAGTASGAVFFNIGNCYARLGKPGLALVNYERARLYIPQDSDVKANETFIRSELATLEASPHVLDRFFDGINEFFSAKMIGTCVFIVYVFIFVMVS